MKKVFGYYVQLIAVGAAALALLSLGSNNNGGSLAVTGTSFSLHEGSMNTMVTNRKLKENGYYPSGSMKNLGLDNISLEDYHPVDPVPSSKAASRARPIEHGTHIVPRIPQPTPPTHPGQDHTVIEAGARIADVEDSIISSELMWN